MQVEKQEDIQPAAGAQEMPRSAVPGGRGVHRRWTPRLTAFPAILAAALLLAAGVVATASPASAGDTAWRTIKYLDCWVSERAFTSGLGGQIGYAERIYVQGTVVGSHRNPSDCKLKMTVYFDHPPSHTAGNRIVIAPVPGRDSYINALYYYYNGESSIKLLKVTMYACKSACSDGVTYPSLS